MRFTIDSDEKSVSFQVPQSVYSKDGLQIAAHIFSPRAEVYLDETGKKFDLTLKSKKKSVAPAELESLGGEFLNELLNQEYRFIVGRFNQKLSSFTVTQALFSARGGEEIPKAHEAESTPEFKSAVEELMKTAREEIARTMPKKIPPQGTPIPQDVNA